MRPALGEGFAQHAPPRPASREWLRLARVASTIFAAATACATVALGFWTLFSRFAAYDDSGYFLISTKAFLTGDALYDRVHAEYGPFFFEFMAGVFTLTGLPVTNDSGDAITLALWVGAAALLAVAAYSRFRSPPLAIVVYVIAFRLLASAPNEPASPGHLIALLAAAIVAVTVFQLTRRPRLGFFLIGALCSMALLSKINTGLFVLAALAYAFMVASPRLLRSRAPAWILTGGLVLGPFVLMARSLHEPAYTRFAIHVASCALAIAIVNRATSARGRNEPGLPVSLVGWTVAGATSVLLISIGFVLFRGTSPSALGTSLVDVAFDQLHTYSTPLLVPWEALVWDGISVAVAIACSRTFARPPGRIRFPPAAAPVARIVVGIVMWVELLGPTRLAWPATLAWVAAVSPRHRQPGAAERFFRAFLPVLALLRILQAYPVAGSQVVFGSFLFVFVGAVCVADGLGDLELGALPRRLVRNGIVLVIAAWASAAWLLVPLVLAHDRYSEGVAIGVRGAERIHVGSPQAATLRRLVMTIERRCRTFITSPGLGSLYLMANETPPTYRVGSAWIFGSGRADQRRALDEVRGVAGLCAVRSPALERFWARGRAIPQGPLYRFVRHAFRTVETIGGYHVMVRSRPAE